MKMKKELMDRDIIRCELQMLYNDEVQEREAKEKKNLERQEELSRIRNSLEARRWCFVEELTDEGRDECPYTEEEINWITFRWELEFCRKVREETL